MAGEGIRRHCTEWCWAAEDGERQRPVGDGWMTGIRKRRLSYLSNVFDVHVQIKGMEGVCEHTGRESFQRKINVWIKMGL
jgi:hypothetical protein